MNKQRTYRVEQKDVSGQWSDDYTWNQGGNKFKTKAEAARAIKFFLRGYTDSTSPDFRISENS